jgi:hypothetical protein
MSNKQKSREDYRNEYMAYLQAEISNQKVNLDANRMFDQTGVPSRPVDVRTITEKIAEEEERGGLRDLARQQLNTITNNAQIAFDIVQSLDSEKVKFLLQQFSAIQRDIESRFGSIPSVLIFNDYFEKFIENYEKTKGVQSIPNIEEITNVVDEAISAIKQQIERPGADGSYTVNYNLPTDDEIRNMAANAIRKVWTDMKKEVKRQYTKELGLTQEQLDKRRNILSLISNNKKSRDEGGLGGHTGANVISWINQFPDQWGMIREFMSGIQGSGIRGGGVCGIRRKDQYCEFGDYVIDNDKLYDNILSLKTKSKIRISDIPTQSISNNVSDIVKQIIGGNIPNPEHIAKLSHSDQQLLHKIIRRAKLQNQVRIDLPNKDSETKDLERFEILRGQLIAGNDSREMIKEFKQLLLKFKNTNRIPKREVNEIFHDLLLLGY